MTMSSSSRHDDDDESDGDRPKSLGSLDRASNSNLVGGEIENEALIPPRPPSLGSPNRRPPTAAGPPPSHHHSSDMSAVSDISFDSPASPRDGKVVAGILEQVSETGAVETPSKRVQRQLLTVADIKGASPMEAEAETLLLQTLEDKESKPDASEAILPNVPIEGMALFEGEPVDPLLGADDDVEEKAFHQVADAVRASNTSTKRKLGGLTNAMRLLHKKNTIDEEQHVPATGTDSFLNHANVLFRQSNAGKEKEADTPNGEAPEFSSAENNDVEEGGSTPSSKPNPRVTSPIDIAKHAIKGAKDGVTTELTTWQDFVEPKRSNAWKYAKWLITVLILPLLIIATILFYGAGNPMVRDTGASVSWVCLFILRNLITFSLAKFTEVVVIDYLSLRRRFAVKVNFLFCRQPAWYLASLLTCLLLFSRSGLWTSFCAFGCSEQRLARYVLLVGFLVYGVALWVW